MSLRVDEALRAHSRGWVLTPLDGKRPILKDWTRLEPPSEGELREMALAGNIGLRTGPVSGVVALDVDMGPGLDRTELVAELPKTVTVETGGGGLHLYFRQPDFRVSNADGHLPDKVDVRGDGGQVVFVGSVHPETGIAYRWAEGLSPDEVDLADWPCPEVGEPRRIIRSLQVPRDSAVSRAIARYNADHPRDYPEKPGTCPICEHNDCFHQLPEDPDRWFCFSKQHRAGGHIHDAGHWGSAVDIDAHEAGLKVSQLLQREGYLDPIRGFSQTDVGNAMRLVAQFGEDLRYCSKWEKWLVWDGRRWSQDLPGQVIESAKQVARSIREEAKQTTDDETRERLSKWAKNSESRNRIDAMIALARSDPAVRVLPEGLDPHPNLLNCRNGTVDLRTGLLRPHSREDMITGLVSIDYNPGARAPVFRAFLEQVLPERETRDFVIRVLGYGASGDPGEDVLVLLVGNGANGKSTLADAYMHVLGEYSSTAPASLLMASKTDRHPTEMAYLYGKRVVVAIETPEGGRWDACRVKMLTGGDKITARRMREDLWEFDPTHTLFVLTNHAPATTAVDDGFWRRMVVVPFDVQVARENQDPALPAKLRGEAEGILRMVVGGAVEYFRDGLRAPKSVLEAIAGYRQEEDELSEFQREFMVLDPASFTETKELYERYRSWAIGEGLDCVGRRTFTKRLKHRGLPVRDRKGRSGVVGYRLKS